MTNVIVTSTTNCVSAVFNDLSAVAHRQKSVRRKEHLSFDLMTDRIVVKYLGEESWEVCYEVIPGALIIDSINGTSVTSLSDLYDKLSNLII